jgi:hypothetical protein
MSTEVKFGGVVVKEVKIRRGVSSRSIFQKMTRMKRRTQAKKNKRIRM